MATILGKILKGVGKAGKAVLSTNPITGGAVSLAETLFQKKSGTGGVAAGITNTTATITPQTMSNGQFLPQGWQLPDLGGIFGGNKPAPQPEKTWFEKNQVVVVIAAIAVPVLFIIVYLFKK